MWSLVAESAADEVDSGDGKCGCWWVKFLYGAEKLLFVIYFFDPCEGDLGGEMWRGGEVISEREVYLLLK